MKRVAGVLGLSGVVVLALTMTPSQHDFGRVGVLGSSPGFLFRVALPPGATLTDSIDVNLVGADPMDFATDLDTRDECGTPNPNGTINFPGRCDISVIFFPKSIGPKTARMEVVYKGTRVSATLKGIGVAAICEPKVVMCNYAHLYSGSFSWQSDLNGQYGQNKKSVTVTVVNGRATCDGTETDVSIDGQGHRTTSVGSIQGDGLIGIEFVEDSQLGLVYRISAACPSPQWPPSLNRSVEVAELGSSYYEESYKIKAQSAGQAAIRGSRNVAHPDTDPANGVTGSMSVSWAFTRS